MNTPIYDFLIKYYNMNVLRLHMPGHKGKATGNMLSSVFPLDITEICGADSLFDASGIIAESEWNAAKLFNTQATFYSAGGSTLCIQAMLAIVNPFERTVIAGRNAHRAFINSCALLDLDTQWVYPSKKENNAYFCQITAHDIESEINKAVEPACVYITSPDYFGNTADIAEISDVCRKHKIPLLVDNAHGAHLAFLKNNIHPIALGADMCCDSAHKMLPALTGAAYLHINNKAFVENAKSALSLFGSTSPSYLILASLDLCNKYLSENMRSDAVRLCQNVKNVKDALSQKFAFCESEPFRLTVNAAKSGISGYNLAEKLREKNIECEYADDNLTVLLFSTLCSNADFTILKNAMNEIILPDNSVTPQEITHPRLRKAMTIRQAVFSPNERIPVEQSCGRICSVTVAPCPPALPIAVSGEIITDECIFILKRYGINEIVVVK